MKNVCAGLLVIAAIDVGRASARPANEADGLKPVLHSVSAVRAAKPPAIDGDLSDEVWQKAPEITGFTQHDPDDGKPSTQKTVVKVAYDDNALYIAAKLEDTNPVTTLLGRRDNDLESDWFRIYVDAQHDRLSGASFWVNPSNVQIDMNLYNDIYNDWSWDAVWPSATKIVSDGWTAEVKIPFSQLRFQERAEQVWGVNFARRIARNKEVSWLVNTPKGQTGTVSRFADLTGIRGIHPERSLEIVPYGVARSDLANRIPAGDPFTRPSDYRMDAGVDVKYAVSSTLRLTGTLNPDFGQVEVDPAVLNLSEFETFFPEKRPFFTEGASIFSFGSGPAHFRANFNFFGPSLFYSRRIGRSPQAVGSLDGDYIDAPVETTILGAAKLSGKVGKGWSIGVLDALTDAERAHVGYTPATAAELGRTTLRDRRTVEPMTNYLVARATKEYGNSRIGFMFTDVKRRLPDELKFLRSDAYAFGVDGYTQLRKKEWLWEWLVDGTRVEGSPQAIALTQSSPARYYTRPDAEYLRHDPTRTSLSGWGGRAMLGKQTGHWRPNIQIQAYSPGFEPNDVGFMPRTDAIVTHAVLQYFNDTPTKHFRERSFWVGKYQNWNFGKDLLANGIYGNWFLERKNYWYVYGWGGANGRVLDDRKTRGGPVAARASDYNGGIGMGSDSRKKVSFEWWVEAYEANDTSWERGTGLAVIYRPTTSLKLTLNPHYYREYGNSQYVAQFKDDSATATFGKRYVYAGIDRHTFDLGLRADWTASARLSFQLYMQPFVATGDYHDFKSLARPRTDEYTPYAYAGNPDFNFRSLRGSGVVRWEFRPGSALYFVWNENRARQPAVRRLPRAPRRLRAARRPLARRLPPQGRLLVADVAPFLQRLPFHVRRLRYGECPPRRPRA
jgi:Domain of unknown function (DUF5916)/Carbohydrate family 9 binding domain-like